MNTRRADRVSEIETGTVTGLTHEGAGIVREGKTAFVGGALPGETIRFQRVKRHRQYDDASLIEVLEPSPERTQPRCAHFGVCGGCALQHLQPEAQLRNKEAELRDNLERIAQTSPEQWFEPMRGPVWGYRRRARLGARYVTKKGKVVVGFRERLASYIADISRCEVLAPPVGELIEPLARLLDTLSIREHIPQIEVAVADNATALVLRVMRPPTPADLEKLRAFERAHGLRFYLQTGGVQTVERLQAGTHEQAADPEEPLFYALPAFDLKLRFRPTDFVQINAVINEALVTRAVELLAPTPDSRVLDLFCGLGNFTLALARRAGHVVGVEGDAALVERARENASLNGISNVEFHAADLSATTVSAEAWLRQQYTHVLLDPPRTGAREMLPAIARLAPQRVVYISCHPGSLARDIQILVHEHGFVLHAAGVLDMFPHTAHVESIAVLEPGRR